MKIVVCHPGKQYINPLLTGLDRRGVLARFYTMFAANKVSGRQFFPKKWQAQVQKFFFKDLDESRIAHFPVLFFMLKLMRSEYWCVRLPWALFDRWTERKLRGADFDIVIGYENTTLATFTAAKKAGKITVLDMGGVHHGFQNPILTAVGAYQDPVAVDFISKKKEAALAVTDHVLTLSKFGERALLAAGFPPERVHTVYLGINQSVFSPKKGYRTGGDGPLELYFVGTLSRRKGIQFAVDIVKSLRDRGMDVRLTLIGPVDDFDPKGLDTAFCRHIPFVAHAELVGLHHALDLFVFPSNLDSWAQTVVEAMACGSPVLVSTHTGAQEAVEQGGGLVLPVGDHAAWAEAVERFYRDRFLLKKMGEAAVGIAGQYTWEAYQDQVFGALEGMMKGK